MKKTMLIILNLLLALALLAGCGKGAPAESEELAGLPNPLRPSSREEIAARFGVDLKAPEGASDPVYTTIETEPAIAQLRFTLDGLSWTARAAKAEAYADISGMYYEWREVTAEEGADGSIRLIPGGAGVLDRYDGASGTILSLSLDEGASPEALEKTARLLWGAGENEELAALLDALHGGYFPGTAGSSLTAAARAAELADFFTESGVTPNEVDTCVRGYTSALSQEDAQLFELQLNGAVSAFSYLTAEGGEGVLSDCGYEARHFPWDDENVKNCFVALLGSD